MPVFGWDASDFDWDRGPMDLGAAVQDGITFFTYKATEGTKVKHAHYGEAINRAKAAGMPLMGAYAVPRTPGNNGHGSIQEQVNFFLSYLDSQTPGWWTAPEFFLQVDTEHWGYDDVAPQYGAEMCRLLRAQTGKWVVHYAPRWAYGDTIGGTDPLWASSYGTNPAVPYRQAYPGDGAGAWTAYSGRTPTFLQYGSKLTIGTQPGCDGNAFRGTIDQLRALISGGKNMSLTPEEKKEIVGAILHGGDPAGRIFPGRTDDRFVETGNIEAVEKRLTDAIAAAKKSVETLASGGVTQAMHDAAILKAMQDPGVQKGIGDAIATHLHVN